MDRWYVAKVEFLVGAPLPHRSLRHMQIQTPLTVNRLFSEMSLRWLQRYTDQQGSAAGQVVPGIHVKEATRSSRALEDHIIPTSCIHVMPELQTCTRTTVCAVCWVWQGQQTSGASANDAVEVSFTQATRLQPAPVLAGGVECSYLA